MILVQCHKAFCHNFAIYMWQNNFMLITNICCFCDKISSDKILGSDKPNICLSLPKINNAPQVCCLSTRLRGFLPFNYISHPPERE